MLGRMIAILVTTTGLWLSGCGPCAGGKEPPEGSCTCEDGEVLSSADCPLCDGTGPVDLGTIESAAQRGSVSALCSREYSFSVREPSRLRISLGSREGATATVRPDRDDAMLGAVSASSGMDGNLTIPVDGGAYVLVITTASSTNVGFDFDLDTAVYGDDARAAEPGDSARLAFDIGDIGDVLRFSGFVGVTNSEDYYRIGLAENSAFTWQLSDVQGEVTAQLFVDDALPDESSPYRQISASNGEATETTNLQRGSYLVRVIPARGSALYTIAFTAEPYSPGQPAQDPGDDKNHALDLGVLTKLDEKGGFVGVLDPEDYYRFELAEDQTLTLSLSEVSGHVIGQLFFDQDILSEDAPHDSILASPDAPGNYKDSLPKGIYFVRVLPVQNKPSLYKLSLSTEQQ